MRRGIIAEDLLESTTAEYREGEVLPPDDAVEEWMKLPDYFIDSGDIALTRYTANGTLDTSFGSGGAVVTAIGSGTGEA